RRALAAPAGQWIVDQRAPPGAGVRVPLLRGHCRVGGVRPRLGRGGGPGGAAGRRQRPPKGAPLSRDPRRGCRPGGHGASFPALNELSPGDRDRRGPSSRNRSRSRFRMSSVRAATLADVALPRAGVFSNLLLIAGATVVTAV